MKQSHINEIKAIVIFAVGLILFVSLLSFVPADLPWYTSHPNHPAKNLIRTCGAYVAGSLLFVFGYSSYAFVIFLLFWSWNKLASRDISLSFTKFISFFILFCSLSALFSMFGPQAAHGRFNRGGMVGLFFSDFLVSNIGPTGAFIFLFTLGILTLILIGEFLISPVVFKIPEALRDFFSWVRDHFSQDKERLLTVKKPKFKEPLKPREFKKPFSQFFPEEKKSDQIARDPLKMKSDVRKEPAPQIRITPDEEGKPVISKEREKPKVVGDYQLPSLNLLDDPPKESPSRIQDDLAMGARILEETLADFGVTVRVDDIERGPVITRYELEPAPGVKVQRITALSDNIALAMRA